MKIAGRKNDGAWFRTNEAIRKLTTEQERANLAGSIAAAPSAAGAFAALTAIIVRTGIQGIPHAANVQEWATSFTHDGIPRQVWNGNLSWAPYTKHPSATGLGKATYSKDGEKAIRLFGKDVRRVCKQYFLARRLVRDVYNSGGRAEGNVGGFPDADTNQ